MEWKICFVLPGEEDILLPSDVCCEVFEGWVELGQSFLMRPVNRFILEGLCACMMRRMIRYSGSSARPLSISLLIVHSSAVLLYFAAIMDIRIHLCPECRP